MQSNIYKVIMGQPALDKYATKLAFKYASFRKILILVNDFHKVENPLEPSPLNINMQRQF